MAGLLGEGGIVSLSGSCNSAAPATLADFSLTGGMRTVGPDGRAANIYNLTLADTNSAYLLAVRVRGLQENSTTSKALVIPNIPHPFQLRLNTNELTLVEGWLTDNAGADLTGNATSNSARVIGFVMGRRD